MKTRFSASLRRFASTRSASSPSDLYTWGSGRDGVLGVPNAVDHRSPAFVEFDAPVSNIQCFAAGRYTSAAIDEVGQLWAWGSPQYGRLGIAGADASKCLPTPHMVVLEETVRHVDLGDYHGAAVTDRGHVYTWGWGGSWYSGCGALGHGNTDSQEVPKRVEALDGVNIVEVACGKQHTLARSEDGQLFSWGKGEFGRLGTNSNSDRKSPSVIDTVENKTFTKIAVGSSTSAAISAEGELFMFGKNDCGQLGVGDSSNLDMFAMEAMPTLVEDFIGSRVIDVACSDRHSLCCLEDGRVFVWGDSQWMTPFEMNSVYFAPHQAKAVAAGHNFSAVLTDGGEVFTWGSNTTALGHGDRQVLRQPTLLDVEGLTVVDIAAGHKHMGALVEFDSGAVDDE